MKRIIINHPGDGEWIMEYLGGRFFPGHDHSLANHDAVSGDLLGGFCFTNYMGNAIFVHDAARPGIVSWCSRDLLWMVFDYAFNQLGVQRVIASVPASNTHALDLNLRAGFRYETEIHDAIAPGESMVLLAIERGDCRWLKLSPARYCPGIFTTVVNKEKPDGR